MRLKQLLFLLCACYLLGELKAQSSLTQKGELLEIVQKTAHCIYSQKLDSLRFYQDKIKKLAPEHPVNPLIESMHLIWKHIPVIPDPVFAQIETHLFSTIDLAKKYHVNKSEAIFFELSARGLLAEYYAERGYYLKAISEVSKGYDLLLKAFDYVDDYPEFLFPVGIYNYFREVYPERNPVYKPFVWMFKSGNRELGLKQIDVAIRQTVISKTEAYIYLTYIYIRYEDDPKKARSYISELHKLYPENLYIQAKYLEAFLYPEGYKYLDEEIIKNLLLSAQTYYQYAGHVFKGVSLEHKNQNWHNVLKQYEYAISLGEKFTTEGKYYLATSYLGAARAANQLNDTAKSKKYYELALKSAQTSSQKEEAKNGLK